MLIWTIVKTWIRYKYLYFSCHFNFSLLVVGTELVLSILISMNPKTINNHLVICLTYWSLWLASWGFNACSNWIFYDCSFKSFCKILCNDDLSTFKTLARICTQRSRLSRMDWFKLSTLSSVHDDLCHPDLNLFIIEMVS